MARDPALARDEDKRRAAIAALDEVAGGMIVGLGTGTTAAFFITALAERVRGGLSITAVATSIASERAARAAGINVVAFDDVAAVDLAVDGVDEIEPGLRAIKGAGGAMLREKIVASAARRMVAIADGSKWVAAIGAAPLPVEVLPFARAYVLAELRRVGAVPVLRVKDGAPVLSDQGNLLVDCRFATLPAPDAIAAIPGVLGHGLFASEIDAAYIADAGTVTRHERAMIAGR
jgi:ribose 5-phosphate isomerase A